MKTKELTSLMKLFGMSIQILINIINANLPKAPLKKKYQHSFRVYQQEHLRNYIAGISQSNLY